jgi:hypothetical protein
MSRWEYLIMNIPADPMAVTRRLNELGAELGACARFLACNVGY